jgi:hypothetical protein
MMTAGEIKIKIKEFLISHLDGRTDSELVRRKRNSSWLLSVAARRRSELLVVPKFRLLPPEVLFPWKIVVGWKAALPGPANRDSLMQRNFNVSATDKAAAAVENSATGAADADVWDGILEEEDSVTSADSHGVLYPAISA